VSPAARDVDSYLAGVPEEARTALEALRKAIRAVVPGATEVISYQLPTFRYNGRSLVAFGAAKNHCSLYVMSTSVMDAHQDDLAGYDRARATVRFPAARPLPAALVKKLVVARIAENDARSESLRRKKEEKHGPTK
jgi:uncharacterized protein YdhG (YjbR/CyaY superfamily)